MSRRHVDGSGRLLTVRKGLLVRCGYNGGGFVIWGGWRWTLAGARRELLKAMEAAGL